MAKAVASFIGTKSLTLDGKTVEVTGGDEFEVDDEIVVAYTSCFHIPGDGMLNEPAVEPAKAEKKAEKKEPAKADKKTEKKEPAKAEKKEPAKAEKKK